MIRDLKKENEANFYISLHSEIYVFKANFVIGLVRFQTFRTSLLGIPRQIEAIASIDTVRIFRSNPFLLIIDLSIDCQASLTMKVKLESKFISILFLL